ncbi:MAG TPA: hypothetical protein VHZ04_00715 [Candidatus Paceibacterota bacterium]|jgi:hypothetical protein|nr:hypothetical protein [Candidatus Paceibacterota bacterium]
MKNGHEGYTPRDLFSHEPALPGEKGYVPEGFRVDEKTGRIFDKEGNEYSGDYEMIAQALDEAMVRAQQEIKKEFPHADETSFKELARMRAQKIRMKNQAK